LASFKRKETALVSSISDKVNSFLKDLPYAQSGSGMVGGSGVLPSGSAMSGSGAITHAAPEMPQQGSTMSGSGMVGGSGILPGSLLPNFKRSAQSSGTVTHAAPVMPQQGAALTKPAAGAITHAAPEMPQQGAALASRHVNTISAADSSSLLPFPDQPQIPTSTGMPQIPAGTGMPQIPVGVDCIAKSKMCLAAMSNLLQHLTVHPVKSVMEDDHIIGALDASKDKQVYCKFTEKFQFCKEKQLMMPTWAQTRDDQNMLCAALNAQIACMGNCANQCLQGKFKSWCTGQTVAKTTTIGLDADLQALLNDDIDLNDLLPAQHDPYCEL
jgi:hypothetical protein